MFINIQVDKIVKHIKSKRNSTMMPKLNITVYSGKFYWGSYSLLWLFQITLVKFPLNKENHPALEKIKTLGFFRISVCTNTYFNIYSSQDQTLNCM